MFDAIFTLLSAASAFVVAIAVVREAYRDFDYAALVDREEAPILRRYQ